jgi:hypothetical protein
MKKLMLTMVALASGLAAWTTLADDSVGASWTASEKVADSAAENYWNKDALWKGDALSDTAKVQFVADGTDATKNYLKLSTGTDGVQRAVNAAGSYAMTGEYFFDVSLGLEGQALDALPTLGSEDKFALFLADMAELGDDVPAAVKANGTNLCAIAKNPATDAKMLLVYDYEQIDGLVGSTTTHRLTIRAFASVLKSASDVRPGFVLYVDGAKNGDAYATPVKIAYVVPYSDDAPDWTNCKTPSAYGYLTGDASLQTKYSSLGENMALSLLGTSSAQTMKELVLAGNANVTAVTTQVEKLDFVEEIPEPVTLTLDGVTLATDSDKYDADATAACGDCTFTVTSTDAANKPLVQISLGGVVKTTIKSGETYSYTYAKGVAVSFKACAVGATATIDGVATSYVTFAEALAAAAGKTATIELAQDATGAVADGACYVVASGTTVVLDLKGQTITGPESQTAYNLFQVKGALTIKDSGTNGKLAIPSTLQSTCKAAVALEAGVITIESGIFDGAVAFSGTSTAKSISGGSFLASANTTSADDVESFSLAAFVAEGKEATKQTVGEVAYWVVDTKVAKTWADCLGAAVDGVYQIDDLKELLAFQANAQAFGTANCSFKLMNDITLAEKWNSVGLDKGNVYTFDGTFDGNGKTVKNVVFSDLSTLADGNNYRGFFGKISSTGVVTNLTVEGTGFGTTVPSGEYGCAMIVGELDGGTVVGCTAKGTISSGTHNVGGICVRLSNGGKIISCTNKVDVTGNYTKVAGICVLTEKGGTIEGCVNEGSVTAGAGSNAGRDGVAGIIAYVSTDNAVVIRNCVNKGAISKDENANAVNAVGQIIGLFSKATLTVEGTNKVLPTLPTVGVTATAYTSDAYKTKVSGLNYATAATDADGLVTLVKDEDLALNGSYRVMAHGLTYTLANLGDAITFDQTVTNVTVKADNATYTEAAGYAVAQTADASSEKLVTFTFKATNPVAQIGDIGYASLSDAVNAAEAGATITLVADATLTDYSLGKAVTIKSAGDTAYAITGLASVTVAGAAFENVRFASAPTLSVRATFKNCSFAEACKGGLHVATGAVATLTGCKVVDGAGATSTTVAVADVIALDGDTSLAVIDGTKNDDGKWTGGTFVGQAAAIESVKGDLADEFKLAKADGSDCYTVAAFDCWADYLGAADGNGAYLIDSAAEFASFAKQSQTLGTKDLTFKLTQDIALAVPADGSESTPGVGIPNAKDMVNNSDGAKVEDFQAGAFQGTFDGQNFTISGVVLPRTDYAGLFQSAYNATIKNLKVSLGNATGFATGTGNCGGGVIAGVTVNTIIENCQTVIAGEFNTFSSNKGMGGIVGYAAGGTTLSNCVNNLNITTTGNEKVGGLIACAQDGSASGFTGRVIDGCTNNGNVTCGAANKVWTAGFVSYASSAVTFKGTCAQNGTVTGAGDTSAQYSIIASSAANLVTVEKGAVITTKQTNIASSKKAVDGLNFAVVKDDVATFLSDAGALASGSTVKVLAGGQTLTLDSLGATVTLDQSVTNATVAQSANFSTDSFEVKTTAGDVANVTTYALVSKTAAADTSSSLLVVNKAADDEAKITLALKTEFLNGVDGSTTAEKVATLNTKDTNGNLKWVNLVAGIDAAKSAHADATQNNEASKIAIDLKNVSAVSGSGMDVAYSIDVVNDASATNVTTAGAAVTAPEIDIDSVKTSAYFRVNVLVRQSGATVVAVPVDNVIGVLKVSPKAKKAIIPVPWHSLADGSDITVANVVKTANLTEGDKLYVYSPANARYDVYTLSASKTWTAAAVYKIDEDGQVSSESSGTPTATTIARGSGVWLERQNTDTPVVTYGQATDEKQTTAFAAGTTGAPTWSIAAVPTTESVSLDAIAKPADSANDTVIVPTDGSPKVYTVKNNAWGYTETTAVKDRWGNATGGVKSVRKTDATLEPGTGFWYVNGGSAKQVNW